LNHALILDIMKPTLAFTTSAMTGEPPDIDPAAAASRMQHLYHHPSVMQRVKAATSHSAAYVRRWLCSPDIFGHHIYVPRGGSCAPAEPEPERMNARMLIAAGRGPARLPTCEGTLRDGRTKFYHMVAVGNEDWFLADRLRYDLRFEEWQDDYDVATRALRTARLRTARVDDFCPVLVRALSLFGPGELRALHVLDVDVLRLVTSLMQTASTGSGPAPHIEQAMDALCAVHVGGCFSPSPDIGSLATVLERHSATITELHAELPARMLEEVSSALACCTRLESLTGAYAHDPAVWLGLSQVHTLRGVDLGKVSFAAIAAALPKLHTLAAFRCEDPAQAADFFTDLLPRLRSFQFSGSWPEARDEQPAASTNVAPLPLLQELTWYFPDDTTAPREFLGAQPTVLHAPYGLISQGWLGGAAIDATADFLARVCDLRITTASADADPLNPSDVARVLRAAPQLKKFYNDRVVQSDAPWLAPTAPTHPAFEGLVHPRLRVFGIARARAGDSDRIPDADWAAPLRRPHFPRLRELVVGKESYFVTPPTVCCAKSGTTVPWTTMAHQGQREESKWVKRSAAT
jgi:hypothetical protein